AAPTAAPAAAPAANAWAAVPEGFYRGNMYRTSAADAPYSVAGWYFSLFKLVLIVGTFLYWINTSAWVATDSRALHLRPEFWNSVQVAGGTLAILAAVLSPVFLLGFLALIVLYGGSIGAYVFERNKHVPESGKVLTPRHLQGWAIRHLSRIGIHLGGGKVVDATLGPPIQFVGKSKSGQRDDSRTRQVESSKGYLAARELVYDSILRRSTDIHMEPAEGQMGVRVRIDGVMFPTEPFDRPVGDAVVNIFKVLSAMDITERRRPQDGSFGAVIEDREVDFRVATQGTRFGEKLSLRILDQANAVSSIEQLGMRKQLEEKIREITHQPHGMFLCCGPTGAGKSTTLYACLNGIDRNQANVITIEDPIEYKLDNATQIEINTKSGQSFGGSLRSVLRQDPDVVMIGEIRDDETAKIACQAASTGHMVFSTVHANDTITALYRLLDLGVEPFMLAGSVSGILGQRLARRLCPHCREAYKPNPELLKQAGLPADKVDKFYRPPKDRKEECTHCGGLGYRGRIGVFELLVINDRMRDLIREKAAASAMSAEARKNGMLYMREEGLRLVVRGVTSADELMRVVK
ncbi:MAG: Flp pilus assembly complex ATPase component TadA, partial [Planctomycetaceae bacterium]|nr:Flp pilus assembly complex ATPase component TadA [Planctomycetaceae bacterium]